MGKFDEMFPQNRLCKYFFLEDFSMWSPHCGVHIVTIVHYGVIVERLCSSTVELENLSDCLTLVSLRIYMVTSAMHPTIREDINTLLLI